MNRKPQGIERWIQAYLREETPKSRSLIISAFGDSLAPYAEGIWLGALIELMAPLGMSERLVRTSVFRLVEEGWLRARREGRRSHYTLTETGQAQFEAAYNHIYEPPETQWDGWWTLVVLLRQAEASPDRSGFRRELAWSGFAALTPGLYVHPSIGPAQVAGLVDRYQLSGQVLVLRSTDPQAPAPDAGRRSLMQAWSLADVAGRYRGFLDRFSPLVRILRARPPTPLQAFVVQTLLIHSFRRANLHDPRLPLTLLDADWPGMRAFELCRQLYCLTCGQTARHLASLPGFEVMDPAGGRLRMPVGRRFGGLAADPMPA